VAGEDYLGGFEAIQKHNIAINLFWMLLGGGEDYIGTDDGKKENTKQNKMHKYKLIIII
jgi:hypothetical protein